ncbi:carboxypeptidase-like regulatory domain-containing protein [Phenylobacterium sp.]|uniref:carboxypeptidase-like regulatory domain-containing protein n=1 Tax=Phenylobacterium sp. TaxID=1871053 RepID=UPI0019C01ECE|nr:carboxypeptidase-like regulatory domain-containing protein [Phenylobacterium sp.]MBC7167885.1 carboxypeptidase regulatory-like domain-containing protein [Phenylobacterium sp.]
MTRFNPTHLAAALGLAALAACSDPAPPEPAAGRETAGRTGYVEAPRAVSLTATPAGLRLVGRAAPGARVRLASPEGEARFADANGEGVFVIDLPAADAPRIYGLSMMLEERLVQAQGYLLILPEPRLVLLRAGAGAVVHAPSGEGPKILAFDYDAEGGAVVSGVAPAGASLAAQIDGRPAATNGRVDEDGRFSLPFGAPVSAGEHRIAVQGDGFEAEARVQVTPGEDPQSGAFRTVTTAYGQRIDWLTPGGGLQSTLLLD